MSDILGIIQSAAAAGVDFLVLPDSPATPTGVPGPPSALLLATLAAGRAAGPGLVVEASTAYHEPYNLARMVASLDHVTGGRAGWWATSATTRDADANHPRPTADRAVRAAEHVPVVRALWDSWEDGAFVHDKATGQFVDPARIHPVDHEGAALRVRGPLNVIRPPQGHPVVLAAASDGPVAAAADLVVAASPGADPGTVLLGVRPFATAPSTPDEVAVPGGPGAVADELAERGRGVRGLLVRPTDAAAVRAFTAHVLPRLRPPGATAPGATTLRARLGLSRPQNRFATARS
ncbi:LLM class flavin-dependent oxidoreductase [Actinokineospora bangkokensis]|uniref:LLM class flavin-dependent oxidoreductase n=1 Tax=Actinokineospora bangkokensis TaxID=1193682 RepID=UPI001300F796|nr:LLM class flavin-dependent oxidoreductase [Actinokineospora bangkokensis]